MVANNKTSIFASLGCHDYFMTMATQWSNYIVNHQGKEIVTSIGNLVHKGEVSSLGTFVPYLAFKDTNTFNCVKDVSYYDGATAITSYHNKVGKGGAFTLGSFIYGNRSLDAEPNNIEMGILLKCVLKPKYIN